MMISETFWNLFNKDYKCFRAINPLIKQHINLDNKWIYCSFIIVIRMQNSFVIPLAVFHFVAFGISIGNWWRAQLCSLRFVWLLLEKISECSHN